MEICEKKQPLKVQVFTELKEKIINCVYPPGASLHEDLLCKEFNVSRTPIRDALGRLEQEGLVEIHSKKGLSISAVSIGAVNDVYEMRSLIEPYAIENYASKIDDTVYAEYIRLFSLPRSDFSEQELFQLDDAFHRQFFEVSNNIYLRRFQLMIDDQNARFRVLSARYARLDDTQGEHLKIASLCLQRNWKEAADAMRVHIEMSKSAILKYVMNSDYETSNFFTE